MADAFKELRGAHYYAKFLTRLIEGGTYEDLMEYTGLSYHTCIRYCKALKEFQRAYIDHYELDEKGVASKPFWKFCLVPTKDAKRPKKTKAQLTQYKREWRAAKNRLKTTSAFTQHIPRYAEGSRIPQPLRKQA